MLFTVIILLAASLKECQSITVAPTWITSTFVQAASHRIINTRTGNSSTPTATMPFSTSFPSAPNLGYGVIDYEGDDLMASEMFEVQRTGLTASSFSVKVQISGYTNLYALSVRYIAISRAFPHHLNSFDNVPINYTKGPLTNISVSTTANKFYVNYINYTTQCTANGYTYKTFALPLSNFKILLFLTSLFHSGQNQAAGVTPRPLDLRIVARVVSSSTYLLNASYTPLGLIHRLHFSIIIFDEANVEQSKKYFLVYQKVDFTRYGGFVALPLPFVSNAIIGLTQYSAIKTASCIHFNLKFQYNPASLSTYGIYMPVSNPRKNYTAFTRFGLTLFYMKTWVCPTNTFFNISSNLCVSCPVPNCNVCEHISLCKTCKTGYTLNIQSNPLFQCTFNCQLANCISCATPTVCSVCNMAQNYFVNPLTGLCVTCTIPYCVQCLTLSACKTCDETNDYFLNPQPTGSTDQCLPCDIAFCLDCTSASACSVCDESNGYFLSVDGTQCTPCNLANCIQCLNLDTCKTCDTANGYILDTLGIKCVFCPIPYCLKCKNSEECTTCDTDNNYLVNANKLCTFCDIPYCLKCQTLTTCLNCNQELNYFLNPSPTGTADQCILCSIPNCLLCSSLTQCKDCNLASGYSLNQSQTNTALQCIQCNISNCIQCSTLTQCLYCDYFNGYTLNSTAALLDQQCILCPIAYCLECLNASICNQCDEINNYFADAANVGQCIACSISQCVKCQTLSTCSLCNESLNYFVNPATTGAADACILCTIPFCSDCLDLDVCSSCNQSANYFMNPAPTSSADQCIICTLNQCVLCYTLEWCLLCNEASNFFLNVSTLQCELCTLTNCVQCKALEICLICDSNSSFVLNAVTGLCEPPPPICGDGIFQFPEACDDGNLINSDGCSSTCLIEPNFICENSNSTNVSGPSLCYYTGQVTIQIIYIEKRDNENKIQILIEVNPTDLPFWDIVDFNSIITISNNTAVTSFEVLNNNDGTISVIITYKEDIQNTNITVSVDASNSGITFLERMTPVSRTFPVIPTDNQSALFYDQSVYQLAGVISILSTVVAVAALLVFFLGMFARKLIGVELMAVIQISYICLVTLCPMNPCFKALTNMWMVNGFNHFSLTKAHLLDPRTPLYVKGISLYSRFTQNYNFTLLLIIIPWIVSLVCLILAKTAFKSNEEMQKKMLKNAKKIFCGTAFFGVMFSGYIVAVSLALQILYGIKKTDDSVGAISLVQSIFLLLLFILYFALFCRFQQYFGQFAFYFITKKTVIKQQQEKEIEKADDKQKENGKTIEVSKQNEASKKQGNSQNSLLARFGRRWYNAMMVQRMLVGILLIGLLDITFVLASVIGLYSLLSLYVIIARPYLKLMHNVRFFANMLITNTILVIYLLYRLSNCGQSVQSKQTVWVIMPLVILGLLIVCIIYNAIILIYELLQNRKIENGKDYEDEMKQELKKINQAAMRANNDMGKPRIPAMQNSSGRGLKQQHLENYDLIKETRRKIKKQLKAKESLLFKQINEGAVNQNSMLLVSNRNSQRNKTDGDQQLMRKQTNDNVEQETNMKKSEPLQNEAVISNQCEQGIQNGKEGGQESPRKLLKMQAQYIAQNSKK